MNARQDPLKPVVSRRSGPWVDRPPPIRGGWKRPSRRRVLAIRDRLRELYGRPGNAPHGEPVDELVRTILSQHTNDMNRDRAYDQLRDRLPTWAQVRDASSEAVEAAIRPGGLAPSKAPRIQEALRLLDGDDLLWLRDAVREDALAHLESIPGVGRKTAACVLIFSFDLPEIPVDVHVYRVGARLSLFRDQASFDEAHDEMLAITPPEDAYELHMNLIEHGRRLCRPQPRCGECALRRMCPYYRRQASAQR